MGSTIKKLEATGGARFSHGLGDGLAALGVGVCEVDDDGRVQWLSDQAAQQFGTTLELAHGKTLEALARAARRDSAPGVRVARPTVGLAFVVAAVDAPGQQRLENLGRMATAIAHDFNNLLSVIWSFSDGLAAEPSLTLEQRADAFEIRATAMRAAKLSQALLGHGRPQPLQSQVVECATAFANLERLLSTLVGRAVDLTWHVVDDTPACALDPGQFEQVIINLALNASDAMDSRGALGLLARRVVVGATPMVCIEVHDTGRGIDPAVLPRIFEPFFTTRVKGKGTGVGLSTVRQIVRAAGGEVSVTATGTTGTVFTVLLPVAIDDEPQAPAPKLTLAPASLGRGQWLLVVEPEHAVRSLLYALLTRSGYRVTLASNGAEALFLFNEAPRAFDALITATDLPFLGGVDLARRIGAGAAGFPVLLLQPNDQSTMSAEPCVLSKPFSARALLARVAALFNTA